MPDEPDYLDEITAIYVLLNSLCERLDDRLTDDLEFGPYRERLAVDIGALKDARHNLKRVAAVDSAVS